MKQPSKSCSGNEIMRTLLFKTLPKMLIDSHFVINPDEYSFSNLVLGNVSHRKSIGIFKRLDLPTISLAIGQRLGLPKNLRAWAGELRINCSGKPSSSREICHTDWPKTLELAFAQMPATIHGQDLASGKLRVVGHKIYSGSVQIARLTVAPAIQWLLGLDERLDHFIFGSPL